MSQIDLFYYALQIALIVALILTIRATFHRRHLTVGQLSVVAIEAEAMYAKEGKERQQAGGEVVWGESS